MKINSTIIIEDLPQYFFEIINQKSHEYAALEYLVVVNEKTSFDKENVLYLMFSDFFDQLPTMTSKLTFLSIGQPQASIPNNIEVIYTTHTESIVELSNEINHLMYQYHCWEVSLQEVVDNYYPARELLVRSQTLIHNAMLFTNESFDFLFFLNPTSNNVYQEGSVFEVKEERVTVNNTGIIDLLYDNTFSEKLESSRPIYYPGSSRRRKKLIQNIFNKEEIVARLCIDDVADNFQLKYFYLIQVLAHYLNKAIKENEIPLSQQPKDIEELLLALVNRKNENRNYMFRVLSRYNWSDEEDYLCISMTSDSMSANNYTWDIFALNLCRRIKNSFYIKNEEKIITIIINMSKSLLSMDQIIEICEGQAPSGLSVCFGVSLVSEGLYYLSEHYVQSVYAVEYAFMNKEMEKIVLFKHHQLDYLVSELRKQNMQQMVFPESIKKIQKYDEDHSTNLIDILRIYLENDRNVADSSKVAYMHRNTFLYQIKRLQRIGEIDFDNYDERFKLMVALKLMD